MFQHSTLEVFHRLDHEMITWWLMSKLSSVVIPNLATIIWISDATVHNGSIPYKYFTFASSLKFSKKNEFSSFKRG